MPVLTLRDIVVFPGMVVPLFVGRERSVRVLDAAFANDMLFLFVTQKIGAEQVPTSEGLFGVGTVARLLQRTKLPDGTIKVLAEGLERARVLNYTGRSEYVEGEIMVIDGQASATQSAARSLIDKFEEYAKVDKTVPRGIVDAILQGADIGKGADTVASHVAMEIADRQAILEAISVPERIEKIVSLLDKRMALRKARDEVGGAASNNLAPGIWFRRRPGKASSSKLGGLPSMPTDVEWPRQHQSGAPLHFLAQIDLSHLPATPLESVQGAPCLPRSGLLFFFADMVEEMLWGDNGGALANTRVIFASHPGPERSPPEDIPSIGHPFGAMSSSSRYASCRTVFAQAALAPYVIGTSADMTLIPDAAAADAVEDPDRFNRREAANPPDWPAHQMLGIGQDIQGTAGSAHADGLILLLQIDSDKAVDKEFVFCDMGAVQFWIKPDDLTAGRFDEAWATTEGG
jgi:uncharacterized protein YwqG/Lon protease-like protein